MAHDQRVHFAAPPALEPGGHIRLVAPASPFPRERFDAGVACLRTRYRVSYSEGIFARDAYLAGSDARRAEELRAALTEPGIDAVVSVRGGYGVTRLLDRITPEDVRPRLLVGFSDVTALHALFARASLRSLHAPMVTMLGAASEAGDTEPFERWVEAVEGKTTPRFAGLEGLAPGRAQGPLSGGNLTVLCALLGTPFVPPLDGTILFLEDTGEAPYRIDRMLTSMGQAGWFARVVAIALGRFTHCEPAQDGRTIEQVLEERLASLGVPVVSGIPVGHCEPNLPLAIGAPSTIDGDAGLLEQREGAVLARR
ncbi:MAG TPA: LD-carboxypeptidase [Polyangiaceae bacterium]|nr:LD-carboxypeptidase [Polyangiaceae bacterium]